ncbi:hypothetical protein [Paenibacillus sp. Marseille-Q7038]
MKKILLILASALLIMVVLTGCASPKESGFLSVPIEEIMDNSIVVNKGDYLLEIEVPEIVIPLLNQETVYYLNFDYIMGSDKKKAKLTDIRIEETMINE